MGAGKTRRSEVINIKLIIRLSHYEIGAGVWVCEEWRGVWRGSLRADSLVAETVEPRWVALVSVKTSAYTRGTGKGIFLRMSNTRRKVL